MAVDVFIFDEVTDEFTLSESALVRYADMILSTSGIGVRDVNIVFMDDTAMTDLNTRYRNSEGTTDVLSFILSAEGVEPFVGEIYVSLERAHDQAREYDVSVSDETLRLVTHGLLHLAGRLHDTDEAYEAMMRETEDFMRAYGEDDGCS